MGIATPDLYFLILTSVGVVWLLIGAFSLISLVVYREFLYGRLIALIFRLTVIAIFILMSIVSANLPYMAIWIILAIVHCYLFIKHLRRYIRRLNRYQSRDEV